MSETSKHTLSVSRHGDIAVTAAAANPPVDRAAIAAHLRQLAEMLGLERKEKFRARAYARGAEAIESTSADLDTLLRTQSLTRVPGIGSGLARLIEELVATGSSKMHRRLSRLYPPPVIELARVLSVERARRVHAALDVSTVDELREACLDGRVRAVSGFGEKTERQLLARIDEVTERTPHVLMPEASAQADALSAYLRTAPGVRRIETAGALRRRVEAIEDLDLVVETDDADALVERARAHPRNLNVTRPSGEALVLHQAGGLPATLHVAAPDAYAVATLLATGAPAHIGKLRARAAELGFTLTDRGLARDGRTVPIGSEEELYERLQMLAVPAELREDAGEVEAAIDGTLPTDLVRREDLQGVVHCHTVYSDGKNSIEEMARGAEALGLQYITITDHSVSASYAGGLDLERLRRQREEIAAVQERVAVRILAGTESDILRDGALDYPDAVLEQLDVVIASVHNRFKLDADAMTDRVVRAMRHPLFKIWGHALGRYVLSRPPFACDVETILDAIAESRAAIEVNGDPHRLDLEPRWIRAARQRGIRFVISADAHSVNGLRNLRWGVDMARRGWLRRDDVLNSFAADAFAAAVRP